LKIYTGTGDDGRTKLFGGKIVDKDDLRVEVYGTIDELNSWLGFVLSYSLAKNISENLLNIQNDLFCLSSELATPKDYKGKIFFQRIGRSDITRLEQLIDTMEIELTPLKNFILPAGTAPSALLHVCRTICRRAERRLISLKKSVSIRNELNIYLNRLSDLLFVMARLVNKQAGVADVPWLNTRELINDKI